MTFSYNAWSANEDTQNAKKKKEEAEQDFVQSDKLTEAYNNAEKYASENNPGDYTPGENATYAQQYKDKLTNRQPFKYDLNGDMLYQQYVNQYVHNGQIAAKNTMGAAAANTGGYASTASAVAAQQAYQEYLGQINNVVPELYQLAYSKYQDEGNDLYNMYNLYNSAENQDYGRWQDKVNDYYINRDYYNTLADKLYSKEYGEYADKKSYWQNEYGNQYNRDYGTWADARNNAFSEYQQSVSEDQYNRNLAEEQRQYNSNLAEEQRQYDSNLAYNQQVAAQKAAASISGTGSTGTGSTTTDAGLADSGYGVSNNGLALMFDIDGKSAKEQKSQLDTALNNGKITQNDYDFIADYYKLNGGSVGAKATDMNPSANATETNNAKQIAASLKTRSEYTARGKTSADYDNYVTQEIKKYYTNGKITEQEANWLLDHFDVA